MTIVCKAVKLTADFEIIKIGEVFPPQPFMESVHHKNTILIPSDYVDIQGKKNRYDSFPMFKLREE